MILIRLFPTRLLLKESGTLILISMKFRRCKSVSLAYKLTFFAENNVVYLNKRVTHENAKKKHEKKTAHDFSFTFIVASKMTLTQISYS